MLNQLITDDNVINIYEWGSSVYGTHHENSDVDYNVIVVDDYENFVDNIEFDNNHFNFYKQSEWEVMLKSNNIECLESIFSEQKFHIKETIEYHITINQIELRKSISKVCSNSYDKCRKKLIIEKDFSPYIAKKSLWHSIRILMFGIQCAKYGKIIDFTEANKYYNEIVKCENNDWNYYKNNWHEFCNNQRSEFRKYSEEQWTKYKEALKNE